MSLAQVQAELESRGLLVQVENGGLVIAALNPDGHYPPLERLKLWAATEGHSIIRTTAGLTIFSGLMAAATAALYKFAAKSTARSEAMGFTAFLTVFTGIFAVITGLATLIRGALATADSNYNPKNALAAIKQLLADNAELTKFATKRPWDFHPELLSDLAKQRAELEESKEQMEARYKADKAAYEKSRR